MKSITNRFGTGTILTEEDLFDEVFITSAACLSVTSDAMSFVEANKNKISVISEDQLTPEYKGIIIILGCQVTDLAVLNDIRTAEKYKDKYPKSTICIGGCLAQRFDIELPNWIKRIDVLRKEYTELSDSTRMLVNWERPFWVDKNGIDSYGEKTGSLFRNAYPLKIGAGCHGKCKYCTILATRGRFYETDAFLQVKEFLDHADDEGGVVIVSDSPSPNQIKDWCKIATRYNKKISFRNVEPHVAVSCKKELINLATSGLLSIFHCPIQSNNINLLKAMNRNVEMTMEYLDLAKVLRNFGVFVATNIIIDYVVDGETVHNMDTKWLNENFDYWVWNPYFDGKWNRTKAEERFSKYIS